MATITYDAATIQAAVDKAFYAAVKAAVDYQTKHGESWACGFAWVNLPDVKLNTKAGKAFAALGFRKSYNKGVDLWNPSKLGTQSMDIKEAGADAFVEVLMRELPGIKAYSCARMD